MELDAAARLEPAEKIEEALGLRETVLQFGDFGSGEFAPASGDRSVLAKTVEEEFDFGEGEVHFTCEADQQNAIEHFAGIAALAADALGRREQAQLLVIANGGRRQASLGCEVPDFHSFFLLAC